MRKMITIASATMALLAGPALAQSPAPTSAEQCGKMMEEVLDGFADKQMSDEDNKKAEEVAQSLDDQCTAGKYEEAMKSASLLRELAKK